MFWPAGDDRLRSVPRAPRFARGGHVYHALNRAVARLPLFKKAGDFAAFQRVMVEAQAGYPIRILAYCPMPNHWHFLVWPAGDGALTAFLRWCHDLESRFIIDMLTMQPRSSSH